MMIEIHDILKIMVFIANNPGTTLENIVQENKIDYQQSLQCITTLLEYNEIIKTNNHYKLSKAPKQYPIKDILNYVEPFQQIKCVNNNQVCEFYENCPCTCFWYGLRKTFEDYFDLYTLEDLIKGTCLI